ncbi:MAG: sulfite exporter TauE/SafE family protein [Chloroflexi bacterium]|nr:sulfite exporter TauE/SafE family protein [Chloroflexota bacterium]
MSEVTALQYVAVATTAFVAAVLGGVTGYGTGLLLPLVLVPIMGAEAVVPVISVSSLCTNASRLLAFRNQFDPRRAAIVTACAIPTCLAGAYGYTRLSGPGVAVLIGSVLALLVPVRYIMRRTHGLLPTSGLAAAGVGYGLLTGGTSGSGVILVSILLAAGLEGTAVIATDAGVSLVLALIKASVFQTAGALPVSSWIMAALIGAVATPGAFVAKRLTKGLSTKTHGHILDAVVVVGGLVLIAEGLRH